MFLQTILLAVLFAIKLFASVRVSCMFQLPLHGMLHSNDMTYLNFIVPLFSVTCRVICLVGCVTPKLILAIVPKFEFVFEIEIGFRF